jgi:preprotein translocase subunit SecF
MNDLMGKRYIFFAISLIIIIPGVIAMALWGLPFSNEFKGGSLLEAQFASGKAPQPGQVTQFYHDMGIEDVEVASSGTDTLVIRSSLIDEATMGKVVKGLSEKFNDQVKVQRFDSVGPTLAKEVTNRGILIVIIASVVLAIYISIVFRGVSNAFRYGICTVVALLHDVLVMLSLAAITGHFFGWEVDTLFLTALLTVIAFSAQDTIVVFDRVRENSNSLRKLDFEHLVNHSVVQTLTRSFNTQIMAVDFLLLAMALFGGVTLHQFATALLVGMFSGSYSSGFNAAPLLIVWENREWKTWFRRKSEATPA